MHDRMQARLRVVTSSRAIKEQIARVEQMLDDADLRIKTVGRNPRYAHVLPFSAALSELRRVLHEASSKGELEAVDFQRIALTLKAIQGALGAAIDVPNPA